jgi:hypothetical protein
MPVSITRSTILNSWLLNAVKEIGVILILAPPTQLVLVHVHTKYYVLCVVKWWQNENDLELSRIVEERNGEKIDNNVTIYKILKNPRTKNRRVIKSCPIFPNTFPKPHSIPSGADTAGCIVRPAASVLCDCRFQRFCRHPGPKFCPHCESCSGDER